MRKKVAFMSTLLVFAFAWAVLAQDICTENTVANLKQQLLDIESRETQLRLRLEELDEALKPGCIERALVGIGSTRPEELREHRRKMLTIERNGLQAQLGLLEESRARVESAITSAENASYLKYEQPSPTPTPAGPQPGPMTRMIALPNIHPARGLLKRTVFAVVILSFAICGFLRVIGKRVM
jgi:hypothetical protein